LNSIAIIEQAWSDNPLAIQERPVEAVLIDDFETISLPPDQRVAARNLSPIAGYPDVHIQIASDIDYLAGYLKPLDGGISCEFEKGGLMVRQSSGNPIFRRLESRGANLI
jgi:hypothetical protein